MTAACGYEHHRIFRLLLPAHVAQSHHLLLLAAQAAGVLMKDTISYCKTISC
jgi:hypothetical protein